MKKIVTTAALISALLLTSQAYADCAGGTVQDAKRAYESGKLNDGQGKKEQALFNYQAAQGYVCEGKNPYEADAAKRAAPLGLELGAAAEKHGDFDKAHLLYDAGGHFAAADRVFMQLTRANQDSHHAYQRALEFYRNRASVVENNAAAVKVTGAYTTDPKYMAEVKAMPAKALERLLQKEAAAFNEQYLREYVQLAQNITDDVTDPAAVQRNIGAQQAFAQKWKQQDLVKASREALSDLRMWGLNVPDEQYSKTVATKVQQVTEMRATSLRTKFMGAPKLLEEAMDYYRGLGSENPDLDGKIAAIRAHALKLGDEANAKNRYSLASAYYDTAGEDDKARAVRDRQQQLAMQKMQPSIDQMRKQAEDMQRQFGDPAKVEEMKRQAEAMRKAMEARQATSKASNKQSAEELEKELGL
jgi:hypothetical protein